MCTRALAFLLAFVMLWSHPAAQEHAFAVVLSTAAPASVNAEPANPPQGGASGHHPTDNLPAPGQAHAEAAVDAQEMLTAPAALMRPGSGAAWPHVRPARALLAPYLDGPQRPPSTGRLVA